MDYQQMLGTGITPPAAPQGQPAAYTGMVQPGPNEVVQQLMRPAQSPEELVERRGMWEQIAQKIQSDPNLQNAMLFMGAQLMQPVGPGQSPAGHVGQALATGASAYKMGEFSQYQQQMQGQEAARKERESQANIAATQAGTKRTEQTTSQEAELHPLNLEKTQLALSKARTEEEVSKIERDLARRRAEIEKSIPDERLRAARLAELDKVDAEVAEARARAENYRKAAGLAGARTAKEQQEVDAIDKLSDEDKIAYFSKSGKFASTASSAVVQQADFWGRIYDKLPADDPDRKGRTREQYQSYKLKQASEKSLLDTFAKLALVLDPNDELLNEMRELIKTQVSYRSSQSKGGGDKGESPPKGEKSTLIMGGKYRVTIREDGTRVIEEVKGGGPGLPAPAGGPQP